MMLAAQARKKEAAMLEQLVRHIEEKKARKHCSPCFCTAKQHHHNSPTKSLLRWIKVT
jgi:hypothetical protein